MKETNTQADFGGRTLFGANAEIVPFAGTAYTFSDEDNGKIIRCDSASPVTLTAPKTLALGFNAGFAQWGAGAVTVSPGAGATNRTTATGTVAQYALAALIVLKNSNGGAAEFVLSGSVA